MDDPISFQNLLQHLLQEVIRADAEAQLLQQRGWFDLEHWLRERMEPIPITGLERKDYLNLASVTFVCNVCPVPPGLWARLVGAWNYLVGKHRIIFPIDCLKVVPGVGKDSMTLTITVSRGSDGIYSVDVKPQNPLAKGETMDGA